MRPILDAAAIRRRRQELALSQRALAKTLGVTLVVVRGLEDATNHDVQPLGLVVDLADALGVPVAHLLAEPSETPAARPNATADARTVGAALHHAGTRIEITALAEALAWTLPRTRAAVERLRTTAATAGLAVHHRDDRVRLVAADDAIDPHELAAVLRRHQAARSLTAQEADVLYAVARGDFHARNPSNPETVAVGSLRNAGLLTRDDDPRLTADVAFSLMLNGEVAKPPRG